MKISRPPVRDHQLGIAIDLAHLLQKLEASTVPLDADQYRLVARRLGQAIEQLVPGPRLQTLLDASPAAAEIYENLNYQYAGLCRSPLDASLSSELRAKDALARAGLGTTKSPAA